MRFPNVYGIDIPTKTELVAYNRTPEQVSQKVERPTFLCGLGFSNGVVQISLLFVLYRQQSVSSIWQHLIDCLISRIWGIHLLLVSILKLPSLVITCRYSWSWSVLLVLCSAFLSSQAVSEQKWYWRITHVERVVCHRRGQKHASYVSVLYILSSCSTVWLSEQRWLPYPRDFDLVIIQRLNTGIRWESVRKGSNVFVSWRRDCSIWGVCTVAIGAPAVEIPHDWCGVVVVNHYVLS